MINKKSKNIIFIYIILILIIITSLLIFRDTIFQDKNKDDLKVYNLKKLCKVWGYVKYTHPAFLLGEKDWDEELLNLIPIIEESKNEKEVNNILYDWFIGLGEIDYGNYQGKFIEWEIAKEEDKIVQVDTNWIKGKSYLGDSLSEVLLEIREIPELDRSKAPVLFEKGLSTFFENEKIYKDMDYSDSRYRLLSLFRFWNAIEYYYPYLDILDDDWNLILEEYIEIMLSGIDKHSYNRTLASLSTKLHDGHTFFSGTQLEDAFEFYEIEFGKYIAPVYLTKAEGKYVVERIDNEYKDTCPLLAGDIPIEINGKKIEDVIEDLKKYISIPNNEKILNPMGSMILISHEKIMNITVLRDNDKIEYELKGMPFNLYNYNNIEEDYKILESNIGLINPSKLKFDEVDMIMKDFKNTDGIIIDLRQYPKSSFGFLQEYLFDKRIPYASFSIPSRAVPGVFINTERFAEFSTELIYENPIVILMDETTQSAGETSVLSLREASNVTVMGENSIGANGDVSFIQLPCGNAISFSAIGVYTAEGKQTQRIGLSPEIHIEKTIEGVREGRDEYIEEAIKYILENK
ncbi:S41 family peptidase [Tissierella sp. MB52-C2]|uniref:S41 family peptidase n=1 Tax=Tissierella sp. MB52-C2 TaxID=3070999 RepID=UPI00280A8E97|nr:S41 family peptidase [Tissierella sp. MB52-C2]WMM26520.1 S41 family peptidase [Tissierella sp. MB52-C2]